MSTFDTTQGLATGKERWPTEVRALPSAPPTPRRLPSVTHTRDVEIPLRDGGTLRADLFTAGRERRGVVIEALPYRKDDATAPRWVALERLAASGLACLRVDLRGSGASSGAASDEYSARELSDLAELVWWARGQPWSNGHAAFLGSSYGGFLGLAAAGRGLVDAVVSHAASGERYDGDCHYLGGCLHAIETGIYGSNVLARPLLAPPSELVAETEEWQTLLDERIACEPWVTTWLSHQRDDAYWADASAARAPERITCPTMLVCGWQDGYVSGVYDLSRRLSDLRMIIGPWTHARPDEAQTCGPTIDWLDHAGRFLRAHLNGEARLLEDEPRLWVYHQAGRELDTRAPETIDGAWRGYDTLPDATPLTLFLGDGTLADLPRPDGVRMVTTRASVGVQAGFWCAVNPPAAISADQARDAARSTCYDTAPFDSPLDLCGRPRLAVSVSADRPVAFLSAKLVDVAPDGRQTLVSRGILNLTRRHGLDRARPLQPGRPYPVAIMLGACSWRVSPGHRLRLALAGSDFPTIWAPPHPATIVVRHGGAGATLDLPVVAIDTGNLAGAAAPATVAGDPRPEPSAIGWEKRARFEVTEDAQGWVTVSLSCRRFVRLRDAGFTLRSGIDVAVTTRDADPADTRLFARHRFRLRADDGAEASATGDLSLRSDETTFRLATRRRAKLHGRNLASRNDQSTIPRDLL